MNEVNPELAPGTIVVPPVAATSPGWYSVLGFVFLPASLALASIVRL